MGTLATQMVKTRGDLQIQARDLCSLVEHVDMLVARVDAVPEAVVGMAAEIVAEQSTAALATLWKDVSKLKDE
eukprot:2362012-Prorocentrum_lima.AAC.1